MSIRMEDLGSLAYGGLVTGMEAWDENRVTKGEITDKDTLKKYSTYAFLAPGVIATACSAMGWGRRYMTWMEKVQSGFLYGFPGFIREVVANMGTERRAGSNAVQEAQRILQQKQLTQGRSTGRTYQPEFKNTIAW
jgi:hypothetical protein